MLIKIEMLIIYELAWDEKIQYRSTFYETLVSGQSRFPLIPGSFIGNNQNHNGTRTDLIARNIPLFPSRDAPVFFYTF